MSASKSWSNRAADSASAEPRLLVSTAATLFWYFPRTQTHQVTHHGAGKYYGVAALDDSQRRLLVTSRPDQDRDDMLLELDQDSGAVVRRSQLASRDTHQMIRDGERLLVADTYRGRVLAYALPQLNLVRTYEGFTKANHVISSIS